MESASCLVFAHTDIVPHRIEVILVCKYSIVKLKLAGGIVERLRAFSVQIIFFDRTEKKGVPTCMESSHDRLFNIIFIHPARENQSLNPQLSQLLGIIQYNFYSSLREKSRFNPQLSQLFQPLYSVSKIN